MDDAHEDVVSDRQTTREGFDYVLSEARIRVRLAAGLAVASFLGIFASLAFFDTPESIAGATLCGIGAVSPVIQALIGSTKDGGESPRTPSTPSEE